MFFGVVVFGDVGGFYAVYEYLCVKLRKKNVKGKAYITQLYNDNPLLSVCPGQIYSYAKELA